MSAELGGCGNTLEAVEAEGLDKMSPGKLKAEFVVEDLFELAVAERTSGKSEAVEYAGEEDDDVVSKKSRSFLES